jgi:hypothetical protein
MMIFAAAHVRQDAFGIDDRTRVEPKIFIQQTRRERGRLHAKTTAQSRQRLNDEIQHIRGHPKNIRRRHSRRRPHATLRASPLAKFDRSDFIGSRRGDPRNLTAAA